MTLSPWYLCHRCFITRVWFPQRLFSSRLNKPNSFRLSSPRKWSTPQTYLNPLLFVNVIHVFGGPKLGAVVEVDECWLSKGSDYSQPTVYILVNTGQGAIGFCCGAIPQPVTTQCLWVQEVTPSKGTALCICPSWIWRDIQWPDAKL